MPEFKKAVFALFILLVVPGIIFSICLFAQPFNRYRVECVRFGNDGGDQVEGILYRPAVAHKKKVPALMSVHYGIQNREALQPSARVMAENGIVVLDLILKRERNVDGRRKKFEDYLSDVRGGVLYLLTRDFIDPQRIFLSGHSIGANVTSMVAGSHEKVAGEVAVGYPVEILPSQKPQLLMTAGVFDELHPVSKMLSAFRDSTGKNTTRVVLWRAGDMRASISGEKRNRIYFISFLTDHYVEPLDPHITRAAQCFIRAIAGEEEGVQDIFRGIEAHILVRIVLFAGLFFVLFMAFIDCYIVPALTAAGRTTKKMVYERLGVILFLAFMLVIGSLNRPSEHLIHIYVLSSMLFALVAANLFMRKATRIEEAGEGTAEQKSRGDRKAFRERLTGYFITAVLKVAFYLCAFYLSYILGLYVHAGLYPYSRPDFIWRIATGPLFLIPAQLYVFCTRLNGLFLRSDFSFNFTSAIVWIILVLELLYPGAVGKLLDEFFSRVIGSIQKLDFRIKLRFSVAEMLLFVVVLITCVLLWRQILSEGYQFGFAELLGMGYLFLSFVVIPVSVFTAIIRSKRIKSRFEKLLDKLRRGSIY